MTVRDHFDQVAAVYESLRTTDEAPVRGIRQFLPDRPVTGLDIGCGTGRYTRLLHELLPEGSLLLASDVWAAMLAELKAGSRGDPLGMVPLLSAAEELPLRTASLDMVTAFNSVHHFDLGRFLSAVARVLRPGGRLFMYTRTPQQNARTIWGQYFPGFTEHEQRLHSEAAFRDAVRRTGGLRSSRHKPSGIRARARPGGSRPRPRGATTRRSPSTRRRSWAGPSRRSWPACPAPRSPGLTSTSWSSPARACATRRSLTVRAAWRARRATDQAPQISAGRAGKAPGLQGVLAAARRPTPYRRQAPASASITSSAGLACWQRWRSTTQSSVGVAHLSRGIGKQARERHGT